MRKQHTLALALYIGLAILMTWPLVTVMHTHYLGDPFSDAYEYARHIWWMKHAVLNGEPLFFHLLLGYPNGLPGMWLWAIPLQSFPAWLFALVMPLPLAYNLSFLLVLALNGWSAYFLTWKLTGSFPAALVGGTVFALFPTIQGHLIASHVGIVSLWGLPLFVWSLVRLREHGAIRDLLLVALFFVLSILGSNTHLIYTLAPVTAFFVLGRFFQRQWHWLARIALGVVLGGLLALLFVVPFLLEQRENPVPDPGGDVTFSADLLAVVTPSFHNPLFTDLTYARTVLGGVNNAEGSAYVGLLAALFAAIAVWRVPGARGWLWLLLGAWVLSLGPLLKVLDRPVTLNAGEYTSFVTLPWAALMRLPVLGLARTPARFSFVIALALSVLVAYGVSHLWARGFFSSSLRWGLLVALILGVAFEYQVWWEGGFPAARTIPDFQASAVTALRDDDDVRAVLNLPYDHRLAAKAGMYLQVRHQKPMIGGHIARETPVSAAKRALMQNTLDPTLLHANQVDVVMLHREWATDALEAHTREKLGDPFHEDSQLLVFRVSPMDRTPGFISSARNDTTHDLYTSGPGMALVAVDVVGSGTLQVEGRTVHRWTDAAQVRVPVPLRAGFSAVDLLPEIPCLQAASSSLTCRDLDVRGFEVGPFAPAALNVPVARGVVLENAFVSDEANGVLEVWLAWDFATPPEENWVRFVHIVDEAGNLVAQSDVPLEEATLSWAEAVRFENLSPGRYVVYTGWYLFDDFTRFTVLDDSVPGAASGWAEIGRVTAQ